MNYYWEKLRNFLLNTQNLLYLFAFIIILATVIQYIKPLKEFGGKKYPPYNNYLIFTESFNHLIEGENIYKEFPEDHHDLYKYTPTFAIFMAPFTVLPDLPGLLIWCLINAGLLFFGIRYLPYLNDRIKASILIFVLLELVTANQNLQSNALMTGLLLFFLGAMEKKRPLLATFILIISLYLKIFALAFFMFFLFYPGKIRNALYLIGWGIVFGSLPLLFIPWDHFIFLYNEWISLLIHDTSEAGLSFYGVLKSWFNITQSQAGYYRLVF